MKTSKKIYGWLEDWMGEYFGERSSKYLSDLGSLEAARGDAGGNKFRTLINAGYLTKPIKAGYSDYPGETTPTYIYSFYHPTTGDQQLIDPQAATHNEASIIELEDGERLFKLPHSGVVLNTVALGCPGATGMCGPAAVWTAVSRGSEDVMDIALDLQQAGPTDQMQPPYEGNPSTMFGTTIEQLEGYLEDTHLSRFVDFHPMLTSPSSAQLRKLYARAEGGIIKAYMEAEGDKLRDPHVYAIEEGLPVDFHRYAHTPPPAAIRGIILPGSYSKTREKPPQ